MTTFIALLKREILEHKALWRVPLIMLVIALLIRLSISYGNLAIDVNLPEWLGSDADNAIGSFMTGVLGKSLYFVNTIVMVVMFVVAVFYALSSLFNERQDDSVLFWRSLPISDGLTVLSKLFVALLIIPLLILLTQLIVSVIFLDKESVNFLSKYLPQSTSSITYMVFWSLLPIISWCLFCSSYVKKSPFLFAFITPILVIFIDKLFLEGIVSKTFIINRVTGFSDYTSMALVWGVVFSVVCIYMAILKRSQRV